MRNQKTLSQLCAAFVVLTAAIAARAQTETVLYSFAGGGRLAGYGPPAAPVFDAAGNLYGTTFNGGDGGGSLGGTVFKLSPGAGGVWTLQWLHDFGNGNDGNLPEGALVLDAAGNVYGTTSNGGEYGGGIVFELMPAVNGRYTEKIIHNFRYGTTTDGSGPYGALVFDEAGNLYGTTQDGGSHANESNDYIGGTVFELSPQAGGGWSEKILHNFGAGLDGSAPDGTLSFDATGNLYGTTAQGGSNRNDAYPWGYGTAFELSPQPGGGWKESILHNFGMGNTDGQNPQGKIILDSSGNVYGTTGGAVEAEGGIVFKLRHTAVGWDETLLSFFTGDGSGGSNPGAVTFDANGNLYGTAAGGGPDQGGVLFELTPTANGPWTQTVVQNFEGPNGLFPVGGVVLGADGNFYGATFGGGFNNTDDGTIYEFIPE